MNVTEIDNVFHCDCGFSWQRGKSGAHDCAVGLRAQRDQLAAENAGLKAVFKPEVIPDEAVNALMDTALIYHGWNDTGEWSWVENETDVIRAVLDALVTPETPATDAWQREQMAKGVEAFAAHKRERQQALRSRSMRMSEEAAGMATDAENFADDLRNGEAV